MPEIIPAIMGALGTAGGAIASGVGSAASAIGGSTALESALGAIAPSVIGAVTGPSQGAGPTAPPQAASAPSLITPGQRAVMLGSANAQALTGGSLSPDADLLFASILSGQPLPNWGSPASKAASPGGPGLGASSPGSGASSFDLTSLFSGGESQPQIAGGS